MRKKFRTTTIQTKELKEKYNSHQELYEALGIEDQKSYHPKDKDFSTGCDGFAFFVAKHPLLISQHTKEIEIETMHSKQILPFLFVAAQYTFQKLGLQAERGIQTNVTEQLLLQLKEAIAVVQNYQYCFLCPFDAACNIEWQISEHSSLFLLKKVMGRSYLITTEGEVVNYTSTNVAGMRLFFFNPPAEKEALLLPLPVLRWTGKELIAIHTENIPQSLIESG